MMMEQESSFKGPDVGFGSSSTPCAPDPGQAFGDLGRLAHPSIHRSKAVKEFLAEGASARLHLERLPGYAPELNPEEGIWKHLKYVELTHVCCRSLWELRRDLRKAKERLRHKKHVILGCIRQPGFKV